MSTTSAYDISAPASVRANDPSAPADDAGLCRRKGWLAGLLLRPGASPSPLSTYFWRLMTLPRRARRRLGRKFAAALVGAALLFGSVQVPAAHAATITVDGTRCTLADAIRAANTDAVVGGCRAGAGADVIVLRANVSLTAPVGVYYESPTGLPLVTSQITIQGNNRTIRRVPSDPDQFRLLAVNSDGNLTLNNVTLSGGHAQGNGGAVHNSGWVTINDSVLSGNTAIQGGGLFNYGAAHIAHSAFSGNAGVAIHNGSLLTVNNSTLSGNSGGIVTYGGSTTVENSTLSDNDGDALVTVEYGRLTINNSVIVGNLRHGVSNFESEVDVNDSTISDNMGVGIRNVETYLQVNNCLISGNAAGGLFDLNHGLGEVHIIDSTISGNSSPFDGGGLTLTGQKATLIGSTISGNTASQDGGGVYIAGNATIENSTISDNSAPQGGGIFITYGSVVTIAGGAISGNSALEGGGIFSDRGELQVSDLTLSDNTATAGGAMNLFGTAAAITGSDLSGNTATGSGGGLYILGGDPAITGSTFTGNTAGGSGGGIWIDGDLTIAGSEFSGNSAAFGGALAVGAPLASTTITNSTVSGNSATYKGGGVALGEFSTLTIDNSTLSGNTAFRGGGAYSYGWLTIHNSVVTGNTAQDGGGGVALEYSGTQEITNSTLSDNTAARGGGLFINQSGASVANSTLSGNTATAGGGIYAAYYANLTVGNSTLSGNSAAQTGGGVHGVGPSSVLDFRRALISGNTAPAGREVYFKPDPSSLVNVNAFNLFGFSGNAGIVGFAPGPTDIVPRQGMNRILAPLAFNGGPTPTHALVPGSPAIDLAPSADCAAPPINGLDQRGQPRNVDGDGLPSANECDVGAFELQPGD